MVNNSENSTPLRLYPRVVLCLCLLHTTSCLPTPSLEPADTERATSSNNAGDVNTARDSSGEGPRRDSSGEQGVDGRAPAEPDDGADDASTAVWRKKLTLSKETVDADLEGFVVLVSGQDDELIDRVPGEEFLRFVHADGSVLAYEMHSFAPTTGELYAWVRLPMISASEDTEFWLELGETSFHAPDPRQAWLGYAGVWHLDGPFPSGADVRDSSPSGNHGMAEDTEGSGTVGKIAQSLRCDGVEAKVRIPSDVSLGPANSITLTAWALYERNYGSVISRPATTVATNFNNSYQIWTDDDQRLVGTLSLDENPTSTTVGPLSLHEWHHLTMTWDGAEMRQYLDGELIETTELSGTIDYDDHDVYLCVDINADMDGNPYTHMPMRGRIDEARVMAGSVDDARVAAWYANQNQPATFLEWGPLEAVD